MYVVWLSPGGFGGFTGMFRDAEICPSFPPPKAALVTVASGEKGLWVVWCNSDEDRVKGPTHFQFIFIRLKNNLGY